MTKTFLISTGLAAVSGAFLILAYTAPGAQASVSSSFGQCVSNSKSKTVQCCETVMHEASLLTKELLSGRNCKTATICSIRGSRRCIVRIIRVHERRDHETPHVAVSRGSRLR